MMQCPICDNWYEEDEYGSCPYCSGLLEGEPDEEPYKECPNCGGTMTWEDGVWSCDNCGEDIEGDIDDNDGIVVHHH